MKEIWKKIEFVDGKYLEIGMYVRTDKTGIKKIYKIDNNKTKYKYLYKLKNQDDDGCIDLGILSDNNIIKASYNIIDLIEVGDYVNGVQVIDKEIDNLNEKYLQCGVGDYVICTYNSNEIEDVVTKEQFEAMKYKLGDEIA